MAHKNVPRAVGQRKGSHSPPLAWQIFEIPSHKPSKVDISDPGKHLGERQLEESNLPRPLLKVPEYPLHDPSRVDLLVDLIQREEPYSSPPSKRSRSPSLDSSQKKRKVSRGFLSIPYTWTESEDEDTERDHALERHLLALMHVGLCPQGITSETSHCVFAEKNWTLSELWTLLKERKVLWSNQANNRKQAAPAKTTTLDIVTQDHSTLFDVSSIHDEIFNRSQKPTIALEADCNARSSLSQQDSVPQKGKRPTHQRPSHEECPRLSKQMLNTCRVEIDLTDGVNENRRMPLTQEFLEEKSLPSASAPQVTGPSVYEIDLHGSRVEDDDLFYQTLDAAYHAIVRPEVAAEVASNLQKLLTSPEHNNSFLQHVLPRSVPVPSPHNARSETEAGEPTLAITATGNIKHKTSEAGQPEAFHPCKTPINHGNESLYGPTNDFPWLVADQPQMRRSTTNQIGHSQPPAPSGFWRQNKLY